MNSDRKSMEFKMLNSVLIADKSLFSFNQIIYWITALKVKFELKINKKSLFDLNDWVINNNAIEHKDKRFFKVIGVQVEIGNREVTSWHQPLVEPSEEGICAFIIKEIDGIIHFLVQAKLEAGNFDLIEIAPTVQCSTAYYENIKQQKTIPFLNQVLAAEQQNIVFDTLQSEEGGRFYREQNRSIIVKVNDSFSQDVPENYSWMTLHQLKKFILFNNYVNIQARSLISAISYNK